MDEFRDDENFDIEILNTDRVTADQTAGTIRYGYDNSETLAAIMDDIRNSGGQILYSVDDSYISPRPKDPMGGDPEGDGDGIAGNNDDQSTTANPDGEDGYDARVNIPTGGYDGDGYEIEASTVFLFNVSTSWTDGGTLLR